MGFFELLLWTGIYLSIPYGISLYLCRMFSGSGKAAPILAPIILAICLVIMPDALKEGSVQSICAIWNGKDRGGPTQPGEFPVCEQWVGYAFLFTVPSARNVEKWMERQAVKAATQPADGDSRKSKLARLLPVLAYEHRSEVRELFGQNAETFPLPRDGASIIVNLPPNGTMFEGRRLGGMVEACAAGNPLSVFFSTGCATICAAGLSSMRCTVRSGDPFLVGAGISAIIIRNADPAADLVAYQVLGR